MTPYKILIASFLLEEESAFWNTVRHEYAHAAAALLTGKNQGHGSDLAGNLPEDRCRSVRLARECPAQQEKKKKQIQYEIICQTCGAVMKECAAAGL